MIRKRYAFFFIGLAILFASEAAQATHPASLPDTRTTPNESYNIRYTDNNPYDPNNIQVGNDMNYFPSTQAKSLADALDNNDAASQGAPNGYHAGYSDEGFYDADFDGASKDTLVFDCGPHGGCDSGNAPPDLINIPAGQYIQAAEQCLRLVVGHELYHHVQYAYITFNKWSSWGTMPVEGTARLMQDKIYSDLDANGGCITYLSTVNEFLGLPNQNIWNSSYRSALFWNYMSEQFGSITNEPEVGIDFIRTFWENAETNNASPDTVATVRDTLQDYDPSATLENVFHDFTITNFAKELDASGLVDATTYRYIDENDGVSGSYNPVSRRWSGTIPPQKGPTADSVVSWGANYYEANIQECTTGVVGFKGEGNPAGYALLTIKGTDDVASLHKSVTDRFVRAFIQRPADPYTRLVAVVTGFDDAPNFDYIFDCAGYKLQIKDPNFTYQAYAGLPDEPETILVKVVVSADFLDDATVEGLLPGDFTVFIGADIPDDEAQVITGAYVQGEYWLVVQAPPKAVTGEYDLIVQLGNVSAANDLAVLYEKRVLDEMLVIDRSGSMGSPVASPKIDAAKSAASLYVDAASADDKIGLVSFNGDSSEPNDDATLDEFLDTATDVHRADVKSAINSIIVGGMTSIGDGLDKARAEYLVRGTVIGEDWIILLSDGMENEAIFWNDVKGAIQSAGIKVHTIALGPLTDQVLLQDIAADTGGEYYYVDVSTAVSVAAVAAVADTLALRLGDAYAGALENTYGLQRLWQTGGTLESKGDSQKYVVSISEKNVTDARFLFLWDNGNTNLAVDIIAPDGSFIQDGVGGVQIQEDDAHVVFHIPVMPAGDWTVMVESLDGEAAFDAILSARVYKGAKLQVFFNQELLSVLERPQGGGQFYRGLPVTILAVLTDARGPIRGARVEASVEHPDGRKEMLTLSDDGNSGDGEANDGVYGGQYNRTTAYSLTSLPDCDPKNPKECESRRGSYNVAVNADGSDNAKRRFARQRKGTFQIFEGRSEFQRGPDTDKDGMPDRYELRHTCLDPKIFEPDEDYDNDDLININEFRLGTYPCDPDTDNGGESDGFEVKRGANPRNPIDDDLPRPTDVEVINWQPDHQPPIKLLSAANLLRFPVSAQYVMVIIQRSEKLRGSFKTIAEFNPRETNGFYSDEGLQNGKTYYYKVIGVSKNGNQSAPSQVFSGTPSKDPSPPVGGVAINKHATYTSEIIVQLDFHADEDTDSVRVANDPDLSDAPWMSYASTIPWKISPDSDRKAVVYVQFRDKAENISALYSDEILFRSPKVMGAIVGSVILKGGDSQLGTSVAILGNTSLPSALTGIKGNFGLMPIPPGGYDLLVDNPGYESKTVKGIKVNGGDVIDIGSIILDKSIDFCTGDHDNDQDVDGEDLSHQSTEGNTADLAGFAAYFGRDNCPPPK